MGSAYPATQAIEAAWRVPGIVAGVASAADRAEAVFDELRHVIPYAAIQLARWDYANDTHRVIASRGYSAAVLASLHSERYRNDRVWSVIAKKPGPVFWEDCPFDRKGSGFYSTVLEPNGFGEGATMLMRSHEGGYLGMLTVNIEDTRAPVEGTRSLLGVAGAALLPLVAPDRNAHALVSQCAPDADAVAVKDADGGWQPLRDWPMPPIDLLTYVDESPSLRPRARFPWFDEREHGRGVSAHVQLLPTGDRTYPTVLTLQTARTPFGLTRREVQILSLAAGGLSNADIATALHLSTRTVSTHMDHVLGKLQVTSRTAAAIKAVDHALLSSHPGTCAGPSATVPTTRRRGG
ncbi:helix-turn-helix transcriptional regulator [Nocardioides carbamazepini]|uniref:helix-turn-helix transcriptional regulator n=1 Tax=Nocardioides carbamazepini TaxID=2854259 RepID=UPI002149F9D5|nr:helix-turn-helix transcriptional regulator [Nocardioides carbamazepini]MCR1784035.1 helix-turn-helix transcriptional regulator [Nocardioides carbamazepini]